MKVDLFSLDFFIKNYKDEIGRVIILINLYNLKQNYSTGYPKKSSDKIFKKRLGHIF